ncbi:hypothetical protein I6Y99_004331 [Vibrio parahaemolyticus]|nr:hypothetical protein [Vibrio parahaemolyticus]
MKKIGFIAVVGSAIALSGCAASYVKYDVNGTDSCPPYVRADTAMGVSVSVNETCSLEALKKPKQTNEQTNEQGNETVNE